MAEQEPVDNWVPVSSLEPRPECASLLRPWRVLEVICEGSGLICSTACKYSPNR